ncbi:MAG: hypothetical protein KA383_10495 [Phycisphaerae bacterium]|nr:hypothetical protein [Phycisphaerae bacterium]
MSFDLRAYAAEHRLRVRNVHDGGPVPPVRRRSDRTAVAYRSGADRADAIICRDGYVDYGGQGHDRVEFCVLCRSSRVLRARLRLLAEVGATITQMGDTEAVGHAPLTRIDEVLAALRPYRRREAPAGARVPGPQATQPLEVG